MLHIRKFYLTTDEAGMSGVYPAIIADHRGLGHPFNAFWSSMGVFHDCFEHYMEFTDYRFRGVYALNVSGEIFAMGAALYYHLTLLYKRFDNSWWSTETIVAKELGRLLGELCTGHSDFGDQLMCASNYPVGIVGKNELPGIVLSAIEESAVLTMDECRKHIVYENEHRGADDPIYTMDKSITYAKVRNLMLQGAVEASRLVKYSGNNTDMLGSIWKHFTELFHRDRQDEYMGVYNRYTFTFQTIKGEITKWKSHMFSTDPYSEFTDIIFMRDANKHLSY